MYFLLYVSHVKMHACRVQNACLNLAFFSYSIVFEFIFMLFMCNYIFVC